MAIDTPARHIYSGDGSTRVFPIPTYIQGDDYIRIEINGVHQVDRSKWDIVNNSIIFVTAPITTATIDVQVATSVEALAELGSVTNVDIVAGSIAGINGIASNLDEILLADANAIVATTKASEALSSATIATTKASEAVASATSASASATTATTKASEAVASATIASTKASEAVASATSASSSATTASSGATTATTKASEASTRAINALASENKAKKWADESEDIPVESGLYSAKHWAAKAADIVGSGLIDDVSPSTSTVFSSTRSNNTYEPKNSNIQGHINNTTNPHNVTKSQVDLGNVDNTSDANKPISDATATALAGKQATLVSGTNIKTINGSSVLGSGNLVFTQEAMYSKIQQVATQGQTTFNVAYTLNSIDVYVNGIKLISSDYVATTLTTVVLSEGLNAGDIVEFILFTAFTVADTYTKAETDNGLSFKANIASPAFTGTPTAPTQKAQDNSTKLATTAFVLENQQNAPNYNIAVSRLYNTVYQVTTTCLLVVKFSGSYMNGLTVLVGGTSNPTTEIALNGDDINANSKWSTFHIPIKAGVYFKVAPYGSGGFESITINTYDYV